MAIECALERRPAEPLCGNVDRLEKFHVLPAPRILPPPSLQLVGRGSRTRRDPERPRAFGQPGPRHLLRKRQGILRPGMRRGVIGSGGSPALQLGLSLSRGGAQKFGSRAGLTTAAGFSNAALLLLRLGSCPP